MTKAIVNTYERLNENLAKMNYIVFAACLFLVVIYIFNIFLVISKTVALQKIESVIITANSSVDSLDSQYLALSGKITPDNLSAYGMSQGKVSVYIGRSDVPELGMASNINHVALGTHEF